MGWIAFFREKLKIYAIRPFFLRPAGPEWNGGFGRNIEPILVQALNRFLTKPVQRPAACPVFITDLLRLCNGYAAVLLLIFLGILVAIIHK
jgi:hypothetical protein